MRTPKFRILVSTLFMGFLFIGIIVTGAYVSNYVASTTPPVETLPIESIVATSPPVTEQTVKELYQDSFQLGKMTVVKVEDEVASCYVAFGRHGNFELDMECIKK